MPETPRIFVHDPSKSYKLLGNLGTVRSGVVFFFLSRLFVCKRLHFPPKNPAAKSSLRLSLAFESSSFLSVVVWWVSGKSSDFVRVSFWVLGFFALEFCFCLFFGRSPRDFYGGRAFWGCFSPPLAPSLPSLIFSFLLPLPCFFFFFVCSGGRPGFLFFPSQVAVRTSLLSRLGHRGRRLLNPSCS